MTAHVPALVALALIAMFWVGWHAATWHHRIPTQPVVWPWRAYRPTHGQANPGPETLVRAVDMYGRHAAPAHHERAPQRRAAV